MQIDTSKVPSKRQINKIFIFIITSEKIVRKASESRVYYTLKKITPAHFHINELARFARGPHA